jgi:hypothetical protein
MVSLRFPDPVFESLVAHLRSAGEQVAFLKGQRVDEAGTFAIDEIHAVPADDLEHGVFHVTLTEMARRDILKWAAGHGDIVVEAHSHGPLGDPAAFSAVDLDGLNEWVPHVRWRLKGRAYAALVFGHQTFDGLAWLGDGAPVVLERLEVVGHQTLVPTGRTYRRVVGRDRWLS